MKTFTTAFFCRSKTNIGRHLRRHCRMPPPIPVAGTKWVNMWFNTCRSSYQRCSIIKSVLKNFVKFTGKHLYQNLPRPATLLKKGLWNRCFPVNFTKFLRTPFLQNTSRRLLLDLIRIRFYINWIRPRICRDFYFNKLTHFRAMFDLCRSQIVGFY